MEVAMSWSRWPRGPDGRDVRRCVRTARVVPHTPVPTFTDDCTSNLIATNGVMVKNGGCLEGQTGLGIQVEKGIKISVDDVLVTAP
jgi:hypothetical protein